MTADLFVHEDLSKPENRINLSLFGSLTVARFREWFLGRLDLPAATVIYPTINVVGTEGSVRPDFVAKHADTGVTLAWIEVECGRDDAQLERFRRQLPERVLAVWGRAGAPADLGLDEIAAFLDALDSVGEHPQVRHNLAHLRKLIGEVLDGTTGRAYKPMPVADAVRQTPFVRALRDALGARLSLEVGGPMRSGEIRANTRGERGFSIRVYSRVASDKSLSVLNQQAGRPEIRFPSKAKLLRYLPQRREAIDAFVALVAEMGADMTGIEEGGFASVPLTVAERFAARVAQSVMQLAALSAD